MQNVTEAYLTVGHDIQVLHENVDSKNSDGQQQQNVEPRNESTNAQTKKKQEKNGKRKKNKTVAEKATNQPTCRIFFLFAGT